MTICFKFSHSAVSDSLRPYGLQHSRPHCPSPTPRAYSNSCPLGQWCHPTISSSVAPFSHMLCHKKKKKKEEEERKKASKESLDSLLTWLCKCFSGYHWPAWPWTSNAAVWTTAVVQRHQCLWCACFGISPPSSSHFGQVVFDWLSLDYTTWPQLWRRLGTYVYLRLQGEGKLFYCGIPKAREEASLLVFA